MKKQQLEHADERVARVIDYVRCTMHEEPDYRRIAHLANLSYSQLFRLFKRHVGCSLQQYIELERFAHAKRLLAINRLSIKEIALQVGYENPLYFSRRFRKLAGISPSEYRVELMVDPERPLHPYSYFMGLVTTERTYGSSV